MVTLTAPAAMPLSSHAAGLPSVTVPSISVGGISTPSISTPSVSTPLGQGSHAPARPTPSPARAAPAAAWSSSSSGAAMWSADAASTVVRASTTGVGLSGSAWSGAAVALSAPSRAGAARHARAHSGPFTERYLRRTVLSLRGCLTSITPQYARDLILRTGVGIKRSYSRRRVARMLRVNLRREGQIEREGVLALRTAAGDGFCAASRNAGTKRGLLTETVEASLLAGVLPAPLLTGAPQSGGRRTPHRAARRGPGRARHAVSSASAGLPLPRPGSSSADLLLLLAALGATALLAVVARQRMLRTNLAPAPRTPQETLAAYRGAPLAGDLIAAAGLRGAVATLRRADERGDPAGAAGLGVVLEQQGDLDGALEAYRRADERGNIHGTLKLGALLAQRGDPVGAIAAYRRADERGNAVGSLNLGRLLAEQGDPADAKDAYRRAIERGTRAVADEARAALREMMGP